MLKAQHTPSMIAAAYRILYDLAESSGRPLAAICARLVEMDAQYRNEEKEH